MMTTIGSRDLERFLSEFHDIAPDHRSAYAGRLKHIARQGFPLGVAAGRGTPAEYGADQLFQMVAVMELAQLGVMPARGIRLVSEAWPRIRATVRQVWLAIDSAQQSGTLKLPTVFWRVPVEALRHMARPDQSYSPDDADRLEAMSAHEAYTALAVRGYNIRRHAFIAADQVIYDALIQLGHQLGGHARLAAFMESTIPATAVS